MDPTQAFQRVVDFLTGELALIRTGRANPALVEDVKADAYGTPTPIKQLAQVSVPEATVLVVAPWDKGLLEPVEAALKAAEVGQVSNDGNLVRLSLPPMTEERRDEFAKIVNEKLEAARVSLRNARREAIEAAEAEDLPEDGLKRRKETIDQEVATFQKQLEDLAAAKQTEIKTV
jgi:ribosome recycling factor